MAASLILSTFAALLFPQKLLTLDNGPVKADVLVVLGGGMNERPERAAELFKEGVAPKVLVSGRGDCEANAQCLVKNGVPEGAIISEDNSASTLENAKFSVPILRQLGARRVIIVTSWYHSRRALACFRHFAPEIIFYSRPTYFGYQRRDWGKHDIGGEMKFEYLKLLGYWAYYGIAPF